MSITYPIKCYACGATGSVNRVTANLQCKCGSTDLDLWDGGKTAAWHDKYWDENDNLNLPSHLNLPYDFGYAHGKAGQPSQDNGAGDHSRAYQLGHQHGTRDHDHVEKHETWGRDENDNIRQSPSPDGPRIKPWTPPKFASSGGTGWNQSRPDPDANWSEYAGPTPGHNPRGVSDSDLHHVCPACNGTGHDSRASGGGYEENVCRNCHGTGKITYASDSHGPTNDAHVKSGPPLGASASRAKVTMPDGTVYHLPVNLAGRKSSDPMGSAEDYIQNGGGYGEGEKGRTTIPNQNHMDFEKPLQLDHTKCPACGHGPTQLTKDKNDDAWWHCSNCGPLANVDKHPEVDPYGPGKNFTPDRNMKRKGKILNRSGQSTGKLLSMTAAIQTANAVSVREAITLARQALIRFPERRV